MRLPCRIAAFILNNSLNLFIILKDDIETAKKSLHRISARKGIGR